MSKPAAPPPLDYRTPGPPTSWRPWTAVAVVLGGLAILFAALLVLAPSSRWRGTATPARPKCASNLHQIGLAILLFQQDHGGHYPDSMAAMISAEQIGTEVFTCPAASDTPATLPPLPPGQDQPTTRAVAAALAVPGHVSYVYFGHADWTDAAIGPDTVVAAEPPSNHGGDGSNVLFGDGRVDWVPQPRAARLIAAASAATRPVSAATVP